MASERILAVGKIINGDTHVRVAVMETDNLVLAAIAYGRRLYEAGASRSACVNENEGIGYDEAEWEHCQQQMMAQEAEELARLMPLQAMIDAAAEAEEYEDWIEDNIWHSRGGW